jgi:hypothetical protein
MGHVLLTPCMPAAGVRASSPLSIRTTGTRLPHRHVLPLAIARHDGGQLRGRAAGAAGRHHALECSEPQCLPCSRCGPPTPLRTARLPLDVLAYDAWQERWLGSCARQEGSAAREQPACAAACGRHGACRPAAVHVRLVAAATPSRTGSRSMYRKSWPARVKQRARRSGSYVARPNAGHVSDGRCTTCPATTQTNPPSHASSARVSKSTK